MPIQLPMNSSTQLREFNEWLGDKPHGRRALVS
jgi:hypothetical protein